MSNTEFSGVTCPALCGSAICLRFILCDFVFLLELCGICSLRKPSPLEIGCHLMLLGSGTNGMYQLERSLPPPPSVKCLLCKQEDLGLDLQHLSEKLGVAPFAVIPVLMK